MAAFSLEMSDVSAFGFLRLSSVFAALQGRGEGPAAVSQREPRPPGLWVGVGWAGKSGGWVIFVILGSLIGLIYGTGSDRVASVRDRVRRHYFLCTMAVGQGFLSVRNAQFPLNIVD